MPDKASTAADAISATPLFRRLTRFAADCLKAIAWGLKDGRL